MKYPFPGINPWMEQHWPDIHLALIGYLREQLAERLPEDLAVRAEQTLVIEDEEEPSLARADIAVTEAWRQGEAPRLAAGR